MPIRPSRNSLSSLADPLACEPLQSLAGLTWASPRVSLECKTQTRIRWPITTCKLSTPFHIRELLAWADPLVSRPFHSQNSEQSHRLDRLVWLHLMATLGTLDGNTGYTWCQHLMATNHYTTPPHPRPEFVTDHDVKCTWWWWAHHNIKCLRSDKCIIWYVWGPEILVSYKFWIHNFCNCDAVDWTPRLSSSILTLACCIFK